MSAPICYPIRVDLGPGSSVHRDPAMDCVPSRHVPDSAAPLLILHHNCHPTDPVLLCCVLYPTNPCSRFQESDAGVPCVAPQAQPATQLISAEPSQARQACFGTHAPQLADHDYCNLNKRNEDLYLLAIHLTTLACVICSTGVYQAGTGR